MQAGELNRKITFQIQSLSTDDKGFTDDGWTDSFTVSAKAITSGGGEFFAAQRLNAETKMLFKIRHKDVLDNSNATKTYRIKYGLRFLDILDINPVDGKRVEMLISCKETS